MQTVKQAEARYQIHFAIDGSQLVAEGFSITQVLEKYPDLTGFTDGPMWVEFKYNWSHGHSTPNLVNVHGGELTDIYLNAAFNGGKTTLCVSTGN